MAHKIDVGTVAQMAVRINIAPPDFKFFTVHLNFIFSKPQRFCGAFRQDHLIKPLCIS